MSGSRSLLYKQLHDFCSGARVSGTMSPLVKDLDDKEMADLAAYYGRLFRGAIDPEQSGRYVGIDIQNVITNGDVARAPCRRVRPVTRYAPAARSRSRH
jgi:hypothetical protein